MTMKKTTLAVAIGLVTLPLGSVAFADYPERPIQLIVPWSAGGGTDAVARQLAAGLEQELGQSVNVVNRTGGGGIIGHTQIANARPDGYSIGLITGELATFRNMGIANVSYEGITPIAMVNLDPAAFTVNADSPWQTLDEAVADIEAGDVGTYTASGTGPGTPYHLAFSGFLDTQGIDPNKVSLVPSEGAAPALQELVGGGIDIVFSSLPETDAMRNSGRVRTLGVFSQERVEAFPDIPTAQEITGEPWVGGTWRGLAGPEGLSDDILQILVDAAQKVYETEEFQNFMINRGFGTAWYNAQEFGDFLMEADKNNGPLIERLGLAQ